MSSNGTSATIHEARRILRSIRSRNDGRLAATMGRPLEIPDQLREIFNEILGAVAEERDQARRERGEIMRVLTAIEKGDFSVRAKADDTDGDIAAAINRVIGLNEALTEEFARVGRLVGKEGKLSERARLEAKGAWGHSVEALNTLIGDLVQPTNEVARVITAVAQGNLSQTMPMEIEGRPVKGAFLQMARTINTMVDQLKAFASEVTRVAREVGTEGKLGGQAVVKGVAGVWKDLTDNVNSMASNLTNQVRNIAEVTTAVAKGDLSR